MEEILSMLGFIVLVAILMFIDLKVGKTQHHVMTLKSAALWTVFWIGAGVLFGFSLLIWGHHIHSIHSMEDLSLIIQKHHHMINISGLSFDEALKLYRQNLTIEYFTGYFIEKSLSLDNIFVWLLIFMSFNVPEKSYKDILFWGIVGAVVFRFIFIFGLSSLLSAFEWVLFIFAAILLYTGIRMFFRKKDNEEKEKEKYKNHFLVKWFSKFRHFYPEYDRGFFFKKGGFTFVTGSFLVLCIIELTDVIFAIDSIPAIFAITADPFIIYFSNIFAILGLRALFFLIYHGLRSLYYLNYGLGALLTLMGVKILAADWLHEIGFTNVHSLILVLSIITITIVASLLKKNHSKVKVNVEK
ncbi:MAG: TerC/Alx family metal homeostasis membrane protein [Bacteroidales bacterium]|nr:TerC/Alx family metal homeostasis membrane protein [Bacteroidales bacterium]